MGGGAKGGAMNKEAFVLFALGTRLDDDVLRLIHTQMTRRIVPYHLRAQHLDVPPPYALVSRASEGHVALRYIIRLEDEIVLEGAIPRERRGEGHVEYRNRNDDTVAVRLWLEPTFTPTEAVQVLFNDEVHYHFQDASSTMLCFDPWLSSSLSVELASI